MTSRAAVAIVGGGLAGGAAACLLAASGRRVALFEREAGPHDKVCGEFLSGEGAEYLARLGIDLAAMGAARIGAVRLVHRGQVATTRLPFPAWGLSRRALDAALLDRAAALGADIDLGRAVRAADGAALDVAGHGRMRFAATLLATGKHDLRGARRTLRRQPEDLVGLKMPLALAPSQAAELSGHVEMLLFEKGQYAGLQMVENGRANLCLLVRAGRATGDWAALIDGLAQDSPHLARRLGGARALLDRPLAVARIPYGFVHRATAADPPHLYRLGDQAGVIPSLCGDGMAIALHSAFAAADCVLHGQDAAAYHRRIRRDIAAQIGRADLLHRCVRAAPAAAVVGARAWPALVGLAARVTRVSGPSAYPSPNPLPQGEGA